MSIFSHRHIQHKSINYWKDKNGILWVNTKTLEDKVRHCYKAVSGIKRIDVKGQYLVINSTFDSSLNLRS